MTVTATSKATPEAGSGAESKEGSEETPRASLVRWLSSSGLSAPSEQVARETIRQTLPVIVIVSGCIALLGATIHILFLEAGLRPYLIPGHLIFIGLGVYWYFKRPERLNTAIGFAGVYLASVMGLYMSIGQVDSALHFGILIVGGMYISLDRPH